MTRVTGKELYDAGLALVLYNITEDLHSFQYGAECITLRYLNLTKERPSRCLPIFEHRGYRVARIEDVRKAAELQNGL